MKLHYFSVIDILVIVFVNILNSVNKLNLIVKCYNLSSSLSFYILFNLYRFKLQKLEVLP